MFGHPIHLNFDQKGNTHQTTCGGCCSVLYVILMIITVLGYLTVMRSRSQSLYYSHEYQVSAEEPGEIGGKFGVYAYFQNGQTENIVDIATVKNFVNVRFISGGNSIQAGACPESFFEGTPESISNRAGYICPLEGVDNNGLSLVVEVCTSIECEQSFSTSQAFFSANVLVTKALSTKVDFTQKGAEPYSVSD